MPVVDVRFAEHPAETNFPAVVIGGKIDDPAREILQLDSYIIQFLQATLKVVYRDNQAAAELFEFCFVPATSCNLDQFLEFQKVPVLLDYFPNNPLQENQRTPGPTHREVLPVLLFKRDGASTPVQIIQHFAPASQNHKLSIQNFGLPARPTTSLSATK